MELDMEKDCETRVRDFIENLERGIDRACDHIRRHPDGNTLHTELYLRGKIEVLSRLYTAFPEIRSNAEATRRMNSYDCLESYKP